MMQHLLALKHFLFLGQGDFVSSFVESLTQEFSGRTSTAGIYDHTLSALLEGSLRSTTARFLPNFVLGNLGAKMFMVDKNDTNRYWMGPPPTAKEVEMTPWRDGDASNQDPWDFIYLEYKINSPLDAIVHASAMEKYRQVFLFLFRLKRVEWMLNNSWRQSTALNHAILVETKAGGVDSPTISEAAEHSSFLLRRISSTRQTMLHFISNLQNYLMFEVLEGGWEGLKESVRSARTVDDVIRAHDFYLNQIVEKTLLRFDEDGDSSNGNSLESLLRKLLSIALKFGKFQDHIFANSIAGLDKAARIRRMVDERADMGDWGRTTLDTEEGRVFLYLADAKLFEFVERTANGFDTALRDLLEMMSKQIDNVDCNASIDDDQEETHGVLKNNDALPFLLFRLDFSGYYARQANRKKRQSSE
jgi:gamma-tubulin complex component 3